MTPGPDLDLTLVRHGATAWNEGGRWQGLTDNVLGERGVDEARRLGARLAGLAFDRCESSDLARAVQTAELALPGRPLTYGQSITDGCIDWQSSVCVLESLDAAVTQRRRRDATVAA